MVVLAAAFLQRAEALMAQGVHRRRVTEGFMAASAVATAKLSEIATQIGAGNEALFDCSGLRCE